MKRSDAQGALARAEDARLLSEQLVQSLAEVEQGQGHPFEVAVLAGLLGRHERPDGVLPPGAGEALAQARLLRQAGRLAGSLPVPEDLDAQLDRLHDLDESECEEERVDVLFDLDELCAGAWFLAETGAVRDTIDLTARAIAAFPGAWQPLAGLATSILAHAPPAPLDPAWLLWRAVEGTRWSTVDAPAPDLVQPGDLDEDLAATGPHWPPAPPPCFTAREALGLPALFRIGVAPAVRHASAALAEPEVRTLVQGEGFELALSTDEAGAPVLVLQCPARDVTIERDGGPVFLEEVQRGLWTAPARAGVYRVVAAGQTHLFELDGP